jgi:hypothetical protein
MYILAEPDLQNEKSLKTKKTKKTKKNLHTSNLAYYRSEGTG